MTRNFKPNNPQGDRPTCYSCIRPKSHCICDLIEPFEAHCNLLILQHPHERRKYYGTAKIVTKAIRNSRLMRGLHFPDGTIERALENQNAYLLFPGENAQDCASVPLDASCTVVVIDGTWSEAGKVKKHNKVLESFPRLSFRSEIKSNYRIRKQPKDQYLSTLESIGHLLKLNARGIQRDTQCKRYDSLFSAFALMVERQLSYFPGRGYATESSSLPCTGTGTSQCKE